jgi:hypothetical protein
MARQTKAEKQADLRISAAFRERCSGIAINVMDISKVFTVGRAAILEGADDKTLGDRVAAFVDTIRMVA